jgi:hypothetical protein
VEITKYQETGIRKGWRGAGFRKKSIIGGRMAQVWNIGCTVAKTGWRVPNSHSCVKINIVSASDHSHVISGKQRYLRFVACIQVLDTWQCPGEYS